MSDLRDMREMSHTYTMSTAPGHFIPTTEAFGARLALIRWHMGWNQKEAALACRLPQGSWREWELSGRAPRNIVEVANKIAEATDMDDYWIMTGKVSGGHGPNNGGKRVTGEQLKFPGAQVSALSRSEEEGEPDQSAAVYLPLVAVEGTAA